MKLSTRLLNKIRFNYWGEWEDHVTTAADKEFSEYEWSREQFPISKLGKQSEWLSWYEQERADDPPYYHRLEKWWLSGPDDPIVLAIFDGKVFVLDGNHRVAISIKNGDTTIDAAVGRRKPRVKEAARKTLPPKSLFESLVEDLSGREVPPDAKTNTSRGRS